jgi:O-antigen ligase/polysaccharide polymerase Wzy-like membrane protein
MQAALNSTFITIREPGDVFSWLFRVALLTSSLVLVATLRLAGVGSYAVVVLGVVFGTMVALRPAASLFSASAFLILAMALQPMSLRVPGEDTPPEYYPWAIGLFLIVLPLSIQLPWRRMMLSLKQPDRATPVALLLLITVMAAAQGIRLGFPLSYVLRQAYGVIILCLFFWAGLLYVQSWEDIAQVMKWLKWIALVGCLYTMVAYLGVWDEVGIFKRNLSNYAAALGAYTLAEFLTVNGLRQRLSSALQTIVFLLHAILFRSRSAVGIFGVVAVLGVGLLLPSRKAKFIALIAALAIMLLGIQANLFAPLSQHMPDLGGASELVPEDVVGDPSFYSRIGQLLSAIETVKEHPLLGLGLGSELPFHDPRTNNVEAYAFVDQGYAYLLSKMGLLGLLTLAWILVSVAKRSGWPGRDGMHLGLFLMFVFHILFMMNAPVMFHFTSAAWVGTTLAFLGKVRTLPTGDARWIAVAS